MIYLKKIHLDIPHYPHASKALSFLDKLKGGGKDPDSGFKRELRKARRFFEHGETTANARNYDYSINMYISGLRHDPDNMAQHEALHDVAKRRKVGGGKPAGMGEKMKKLGPSPVDKMLHAEKLWAMNPLDEGLAGDTFKAAVDAYEAGDDLHLGEVAFWIGEIWLPMIAQQKKPSQKKFLIAKDLFVRLDRYDKAVEACRKAAAMNPSDTKLLSELKDLQAEQMMSEKKFGTGGEGDFRQNLKDGDKQAAIQQEEQISKSGSDADDIIARRRAEYEEDPQDTTKMQKLVDALVQRESADSEREAIELLKKSWEETGQYRQRVRMGDIQMKQFKRVLRQIKARIDKNPADQEMVKKYEAGRAKQLAFELQEFTDRCKNYPTDMSLRYELGRRLYSAQRFDDAIGAFQQAKADPKRRAVSHEFLGRCYIHKDYLDEAVDTLAQGIEAHKIPDDRLAMDLRYLKMDAHIKLAHKNNDAEHAKQAQQIASGIFQSDINFRDIRQRMDEIKALAEKLKSQAAD
jgi:tetratricopeptide (TPR) repeat protein